MKIKYLFIGLSLIQCSNLICAERKADEAEDKKFIEMEEGSRKEFATQTDDLLQNHEFNLNQKSRKFLADLLAALIDRNESYIRQRHYDCYHAITKGLSFTKGTLSVLTLCLFNAYLIKLLFLS